MSKLIKRVRDRQDAALRRALREQDSVLTLAAMEMFLFAEAERGRLQTFPGSQGRLIALNELRRPGRIITVVDWPRKPWWKVW